VWLHPKSGSSEMETMATAGNPVRSSAISIPNVSDYTSNLHDGSNSFGDILCSAFGGMDYMYQSPPLPASEQTTSQSSPKVTDLEPMYVHLPQFWDRTSAVVCSAQEAVCAYEASATTTAKAGSTLATSASADAEVKSDCSTADTSDRSPSSPGHEPACPRSFQGSEQQLTRTLQVGATELDKEFKQVPKTPWRYRLGRVAEAKQHEARPEPLPSVGSERHHAGRCKPCAFVGTKGCNSGSDCRFCHLCEAGEKKKRQKEKKVHFTAMRRAKQAQNAQANVQVAAEMSAVSEN